MHDGTSDVIGCRYYRNHDLGGGLQFHFRGSYYGGLRRGHCPLYSIEVGVNLFGWTLFNLVVASHANDDEIGRLVETILMMHNAT